ncbi:MAG: hypothetical protein WC600_17725 [Desulfobaccales bacterium]
MWGYLPNFAAKYLLRLIGCDERHACAAGGGHYLAMLKGRLGAERMRSENVGGFANWELTKEDPQFASLIQKI